MLDTLLKPHVLPDDYRAGRTTTLEMMKPGETLTVLDIEGSGCLRHLFFTTQPRRNREMILRIWWDGEEKPSVECPVTDFFGIGHDLHKSDLNCLLFYNPPNYGYNTYIPMPFSRGCRATITNETNEERVAIFEADFQAFASPIDVPWRFHCAWRRVFPAFRRGRPMTLLEARGDGKLIGVIYHVVKRDSDDRWTHGGADQLFIDGETGNPNYIYGSGGEDYAHHAWGPSPGSGAYAGMHHVHPVPGVKRAEGRYAFEPHGWEQHDGGHYSMYRFYVPDPVRFSHSIRLTFGTCANEISSTTYWYQQEPHVPFCHLPPAEKRRYGERVTEDETWTPMSFGKEIPVAVLGPVQRGADEPWTPGSPLDLGAEYDTNHRRPFGDVPKPPYRIRWRRTGTLAGFVDLTAIHRPKSHIRARGQWNSRNLTGGSASFQLIRVKAKKARSVVLRIGLEDEMAVWHNGKKVRELNVPSPREWHTLDVPLKLTAGDNDILLDHLHRRLAHFSAWTFYVKFLTAQGKVIGDLDFDDFAQLDPTPQEWREPWPPDGGEIHSDDYRDPLMLV